MGTRAIERDEAPQCPLCGGETEMRTNSYGAFWGCLGYPECNGLVRIPGSKPARARSAAAPAPTRSAAIEQGARLVARLNPGEAAELRRARALEAVAAALRAVAAAVEEL